MEQWYTLKQTIFPEHIRWSVNINSDLSIYFVSANHRAGVYWITSDLRNDIERTLYSAYVQYIDDQYVFHRHIQNRFVLSEYIDTYGGLHCCFHLSSFIPICRTLYPDLSCHQMELIRRICITWWWVTHNVLFMAMQCRRGVFDIFRICHTMCTLHLFSLCRKTGRLILCVIDTHTLVFA